MNSSHAVVTAYYPIPTGKHTKGDYKKWYTQFFNCVTCPVICFCPQALETDFKLLAKNNVTLIIRGFDSFEMMSPERMYAWKEWHNLDPEKNIHSPELYAVWAAKQEFVKEAIKLSDYSIYTWCDIGCFRTIRPGSFDYVSNYIKPSKITCLSIANMIGGGVLSGDKNAWDIFSSNYIAELKVNIHGKDQVIYKRILNESNAVILQPNNKYGDPWFFLTYIFSMPT
jgi:hypothetical protein